MKRVLLLVLILVCVGLSYCAGQGAFPWDGARAWGTVSDHGQVVVAQDNKDIVSASSGEAGPQYHFRLTRAYCDHTTSSQQSPADQASFLCVPDSVTIDDAHPPSTTPSKSYLIAPYSWGMQVEYPGILETWVEDFSIHQEHKRCDEITIYLDSDSCNASAHLWVGDVDDYGGLFAASYDALAGNQTSIDPTQSFVLLASDTFNHTSHGDMLLAVRNPQDNVRFQFGFSGAGGGTIRLRLRVTPKLELIAAAKDILTVVRRPAALISPSQSAPLHPRKVMNPAMCW